MKGSSQQPDQPPNGNSDDSISARRTDNGSLASAFALVCRVICGRRYAVPEADIPDVAQEAVVRLWKWREKFQEKANRMTMTEWDSFTAKTAHNEVNRYLSNNPRSSETALEDTLSIRTGTPEGHADSEMFSLVRIAWQEICSLTLYQRRALLLGSSELVIYLMRFGLSEKAVVASLGISKEDWSDIFGRLPLPDREIAAIARAAKTVSDPEAAALAIGKARFDARKRLGGLRK